MNMLVLSLILLCANAFASVPCRNKPFYLPQDAEKHFEEFITKYDKQYVNEEEKQLRLEIFKENLKDINRKNGNSAETAVFGVTQFTDLTSKEFIERYTGFRPNLAVPAIVNETVPLTLKAPDSFDWREKNAVTRVKNQDTCGSCWAFSTSGAVEGAYAIKHGSLEEFSEQQLVDCSNRDRGCSGGWMQDALNYLIDAGGLEGEYDYPYENTVQQCQFDQTKIKVVVTQMLPYNLYEDEGTKNYLVQNGPIAIALDVADVQNYRGGVLKQCRFTVINHAVLLVGYGQDGVDQYWIVKNSWGPTWGEEGYIRLLRGPGINACGFMNVHAAGARVA